MKKEVKNIVGDFIKKIKNKSNEKNIKLDFEDGTFKEKDDIGPSYINFSNPKYIEIDDIYYSSLKIYLFFMKNKILIKQ